MMMEAIQNKLKGTKNMKTLMTGALALLILAATQAKAEQAASLAITPQIGTAIFNIENSGLSSKSGMVIGANLIYAPAGSSLQYETGLNYIQAGAKTDMFFASTEVNLNYVAIPLTANWVFYKNEKKTSVYLKGGGILTQLVSAKQTTNFFGSSEETDIKDQVNQNDLMMNAGLGGRWVVVDDFQVGLEGSYAKGLTDVMKNAAGKSEGYLVTTSLTIML
jgi:hypothetical protein